ncbi:MAG: hypothetical protein ACJAQT_001382 [Akkermansiaceae bacterium]|jgi:hypothetical protein
MWKRVFLLWDWDGILGSLLHGADLAEFFERVLVLGSGVLIGGLEGFLLGGGEFLPIIEMAGLFFELVNFYAEGFFDGAQFFGGELEAG